jgi:hypothetical protein
VSDITYGPPVITPLYSDERTGECIRERKYRGR